MVWFLWSGFRKGWKTHSDSRYAPRPVLPHDDVRGEDLGEHGLVLLPHHEPPPGEVRLVDLRDRSGEEGLQDRVLLAQLGDHRVGAVAGGGEVGLPLRPVGRPRLGVGPVLSQVDPVAEDLQLVVAVGAVDGGRGRRGGRRDAGEAGLRLAPLVRDPLDKEASGPFLVRSIFVPLGCHVRPRKLGGWKREAGLGVLFARDMCRMYARSEYTESGMSHEWGHPYPVSNGGPTYAHHQKCKVCGALATRLKKGHVSLHTGQPKECVAIDSPGSKEAEKPEEEPEREGRVLPSYT